VLVDAENASWRTLPQILEEIARFGDTTVRRVYGDFTMPALKEWREVSLELSFRCVTTIRLIPGKGSSDASLMIEAMDFLHLNPTLDGFVIVSSDSDFTSLAQRIREAGKHVIGFGSRHTPAPFVMACERFIYTENLVPDIYNESLAGGAPASTKSLAGGAPAARGSSAHPVRRGKLSENAIKLLTRAVQHASEEYGDEGSWVELGMIKPLLTQFKPDFDVRSYGFSGFKELVGSEPRHFEFKVTHGGSNVLVRLVGGGAEAGAALAEGGGEGGGRGAELEHRPLASLASSLGGGGGTGSTGWAVSTWNDAQIERIHREYDAGGLDSVEKREAFLPVLSGVADEHGMLGGLLSLERLHKYVVGRTRVLAKDSWALRGAEKLPQDVVTLLTRAVQVSLFLSLSPPPFLSRSLSL
jgi:hypothetical protein